MLGGGGQSFTHPCQPMAPQNHPSRAPALSRTITAMPCEFGRSRNRSGTRQADAGGGLYISFTMIAPSGTGAGSAGALDGSLGRLACSQAIISGEYQISTGEWVPKYAPLHLPFASVAMKGPVSRTVLSICQPAAKLRWHMALT